MITTIYLDGDTDGEHLRAEVSDEGVKLILCTSTGMGNAPLRFKPLYPQFHDRILVYLTAAQIQQITGVMGIDLPTR